MTEKKRRILITSGLPYANGDIHIGHLLEHLITDCWGRFQKMRGHECLLICGDDTHGAPIMVEARRRGIAPEVLLEETEKKHINDLKGFEISYDSYSSTNTEKNRKLCYEIYAKLKAKDLIAIKQLTQYYCNKDAMFLPDRFVKGQCPKCATANQYGDSCDACGAVYSPAELKDPKCAMCGEVPQSKESEHHFFQLSKLSSFLNSWVPEHTQTAVSNKLKEWMDDNLADWCLTRDKPYFGFEVPGAPGKYFYVWFDAPIGYISSTWEWCEKNGRDLADFWRDQKAEIYHIIGKDIVYFHSLFWPAVLAESGYSTPAQICVHGMLTINGEKLSKSKGTFINARTYLDHLEPDYLRYYLACKVNDSVSDIDLNWVDFVSRVNSDLIGKITNIASRSAQLLEKNLGSKLSKLNGAELTLVKSAGLRAEEIAELYETRQFSKAMVVIRGIADEANKYFDDHTPWNLIHSDPEKTRTVITVCLNLFRSISIYLKPILPSYVSKVEALFGDKPYTWASSTSYIEDREIAKFSHLLKRIEQKKIDLVVADTIKAQGERAAKPAAETKDEAKVATKAEALAQEIEIGDFAKVDLRVAKVIAATTIDGSDKLLRFELDLGPLGKRQVFSGIKAAYSNPAELVGRLLVVVANLKPRTMKFGVSEGMVLCAGPGGKELWLISPQDGAKPGDKIS